MEQEKHSGEVTAILFSLFVIMTGYGVLLPVLPFFAERLALKSGIDQSAIDFHVGMLTAIYPFSQLIFAIIWGKLSDRYGRRRFIAIGLLGFILMQLLIGLSASLTMFYIARILGGVFSSAVLPVSNAYLSDITPKERRSKIMAWSGTAVSTGVIAGPVVGGLLSKTDFQISFAMVNVRLNRFSVPFFALILLGIAALFIVLKQLKSKRNNTFPVLSDTPVFSNHYSSYSILMLLMLSFIYQFSVASFETVFSIYAKNELLFNTRQIGLGFMFCGLFMAILQPVFTSDKMKRISQKGKLFMGFSIASVALFVVPLIKGNPFVYLFIILFAIGGALIAPQLTTSVSLINEKDTAKNLSAQTSINSVGQMLGPVLGAWLISEKVWAPFIVNGSLLIIPVLVFMLVNKLQ